MGCGGKRLLGALAIPERCQGMTQIERAFQRATLTGKPVSQDSLGHILQDAYALLEADGQAVGRML